MYDVIVIGCGPGGYAAAIRTAQLGGKAVIIEAGDIGGTCVQRGCIPSKVWLRAAQMINTINNAEAFGIDATLNKINLETIVERKNTVAGEICMGMEALLGANGVELIKGKGQVKSAREVIVNGKSVEGKRIILATGSSLKVPEIPGLEKALITSDGILEMTTVPNSVLIWGEAGPVEIEMASLLNTLGCEVYLSTPKPRILDKEDHDTSQRLSQAFKEQGIKIFLRMTLESVNKQGKKFKANLTGRKDREVIVEKVLICNRRPNSDGLDLQQAGVSINEDGSVKVDDRLQTSVPGIYAVGDLTGGWMNSHAASAMAVTAAENAMGQDNEFLFGLIPRGVWASPQVGSVGLTEEEAENEGYDVETGDFPYPINGLAMCRGEVDGSVKVVMEEENKEILGVHIVGANATELVGEAVMALQLECTVDELANTIRVHPTFSEGIMDAGRDAAGWALYLPPNR